MFQHPVVDTHVHLWDPKRLRYAWLDGNEKLDRPFGLKEYVSATAGIPVKKMVFLECGCQTDQRKQEIAFVLESKQADPRLEAIIPYFPVHLGPRVEVEMKELSRNRSIKGVRRMLQGEEEAGVCLAPDFVKGINLLPKYDLHFEVTIKHHQMSDIIKLVELCPGVKFVLDHIGKPDIKNELIDSWGEQIALLAAFPNVWCKVSGLVTEANVDTWTADDLKPYLSKVFEQFGFERVMFGSDWPVVTLASSYKRWFETLTSFVSDCSPEDQKRLFSQNAIDFYRLK